MNIRIREPGAGADVASVGGPPHGEVDSTYAWTRLVVSLMLSTIGGVGMWSVVVALPAVQAEFGVARGAASLPYTLTMIGFGFARHRDGPSVRSLRRHGAGARRHRALGARLRARPALAPSLWQYTLAQGLLVGVGSSATFAPLLAHTSMWFTKRRGIAVAIFASGNYLAGTVWPPIVQHFIEHDGWRAHVLRRSASFVVVTMLPLALLLRRPPPHHDGSRRASARGVGSRAAARPDAARAAGAAGRRGTLLLRRDVDAAGAPRRVLRRPGLRRRRAARRCCR